MHSNDIYLQLPKEYPLEITENAKDFGFKAANLMFLKRCIEELKVNNTGSISAAIPAIKAISNNEIITHLKTYISDFDAKWQGFCDLQKGRLEDIEPGAKTVLEELRTEIKQVFSDHPFIPADLPNSAEFMVRSTGEEDRVDVANPGGNESVASNVANISKSIGIVIASYLSEKSLMQRLKSGEDIADHFPLSPCLVQTMVAGRNQNAPAVSGVIYTGAGHTRIQSAPGHGELIVNSKGNFDNYYITPQGKVYAEVRDKHIRLTPKMNQRTGKMEQMIDDNDFKLATDPSLDEETAIYLHNLAEFIEQKYGMRMDIEFVYDGATKTANIVQARPIPEGDRRGMPPSALANQFISTYNPRNLKARVITPDINFASVVKSTGEILICDTIEQALDTYLKSANQIKAVIVKREAPDTSHEAGMFTSKAISVLQMEDIEEAKQWAANLATNVLVCDPQHKKLYQIPKAEYSEELIQKGIYASTLTPFVTPLKREFKDESLMPQLFAAMQNNNPTKYDGELLRKHLDSLSIPKFGTDATEQKKILANLLQFNGRLRKKEQISADLFKEIMLTGSELSNLLDSMEKEPYNEERSKYYLNVFEKFNGLINSQRNKDVLSSSVIGEIRLVKTRDEYLEIAAKKEAGERAGTKSFFQILEEFLGNFEESSHAKLTNRQKELFLEVAQLDKFIMTPENKAKWREFCFDCCAKNQGLVLANLTKDLAKLGLHEYFLNTSFLTEYKESKYDALAKLYEEFDRGRSERDKLNEAAKVIDHMERQIPQWSKPEKFEELHTNLQLSLTQLESLLYFDSNANLNTALKDKLNGMLVIKHLNKLVDAVDLSIKAVQISSLYSEKQKTIQAQNFGKLISDFNRLMQKLMAKSEEEKVPKRLNSLSYFIDSKNRSINKHQLDPSGDFNASAADIYQVRSEQFKKLIGGGDSFQRAFDYKDKKTLADAHTLIHQTALKSIALHAEAINQALVPNYPEIIREIQGHYKQGKRFLGFQLSRGDAGILPDLIYSNLEGENIHLHYNIPLRQHSALADIKYNCNSGKFNISYQMVGASEDRWQPLTNLGKLLIEEFADAKVTQNNYSENHMLLEAQVDNLQDAKTALDIFNMLAASTFEHRSLDSAFKSEGIIYKALEERFKRISFDPSMYTKEDVSFIKSLYISAHISHSNSKDQKNRERLKKLNNLGVDLTHLKNSSPETTQTLLTCNTEVFELLTSAQAIKAYHVYGTDPSALAYIEDLEHIKVIISDAAINLFKHGIPFMDIFSDDSIQSRVRLEDQQGFSKKENKILDSLDLLKFKENKLNLLDKLIEIKLDGSKVDPNYLLILRNKVLSRLFEETILSDNAESIDDILKRYDALVEIHQNAKNNIQRTFEQALDFSTHGHLAILAKLVKASQDRDILFNYPATFHEAASNGEATVIETLLDLGVEPDCQIKFSNNDEPNPTALFTAAKSGHSEVVKILLDAGADINKATHKDVSALTIAKDAEVVKLLKKYAPVDYLPKAHQKKQPTQSWASYARELLSGKNKESGNFSK